MRESRNLDRQTETLGEAKAEANDTIQSCGGQGLRGSGAGSQSASAEKVCDYREHMQKCWHWSRSTVDRVSDILVSLFMTQGVPPGIHSDFIAQAIRRHRAQRY